MVLIAISTFFASYLLHVRFGITSWLIHLAAVSAVLSFLFFGDHQWLRRRLPQQLLRLRTKLIAIAWSTPLRQVVVLALLGALSLVLTREAWDTFTRFDEAAYETVLKDLSHESGDVRVVAAKKIARWAHRRAAWPYLLDGLLEAAIDADTRVHHEVDEAAKAVLSEGDEKLRAQAVRRLLQESYQLRDQTCPGEERTTSSDQVLKAARRSLRLLELFAMIRPPEQNDIAQYAYHGSSHDFLYSTIPLIALLEETGRNLEARATHTELAVAKWQLKTALQRPPFAKRYRYLTRAGTPPTYYLTMLMEVHRCTGKRNPPLVDEILDCPTPCGPRLGLGS